MIGWVKHMLLLTASVYDPETSTLGDNRYDLLFQSLNEQTNRRVSI